MPSKPEMIRKIWEYIEDAPLLKIYLNNAALDLPIIVSSEAELECLPEVERVHKSQKLLWYLDSCLKTDKFNLSRAEETVDVLINMLELPSFQGQGATIYQQKMNKVALEPNADRTCLTLPNFTVQLVKELLEADFKRSYQQDVHKLVGLQGQLRLERIAMITKFNAFLPERLKIPLELSHLQIAFVAPETFVSGKFQESYEIPNVVISTFKMVQNAFLDVLNSPQRMLGKFSSLLYILMGAGAMSLLKKFVAEPLYAYGLGLFLIFMFIHALNKQFRSNDSNLEKAWGTINDALKKNIRDVCDENRRNLKDAYKLAIRKIQQDWYRILRDVYLNPDVLPIYDKHILQIEKFKKELNQP